MIELYELIESVIQNMPNKPEGLTVRYQYLDDTDINTLAIMTYEGRDDTPYLSGGYPYFNVPIHLQYSVSANRSETLAAVEFMSKLVLTLEVSKLVGSTVIVESIKHRGTLAFPIGINDNGIGQVVSNVDCLYNLIG